MSIAGHNLIVEDEGMKLTIGSQVFDLSTGRRRHHSSG